MMPIDKIFSNLQTSGLQQKDPALFQVINEIIKNLKNLRLGIANASGGNTINEFNNIQIISDLAGDGGGSDDSSSIPGPQGIQGIQGLMGPMGAIIFPPDAEDGDIFPPIVGPQGNPGPTGSQGPVGGYFPVEDGLDGEDAIHIIEQITQSSGSSNLAIARKAISEAEFEALNTSPLDIGIAAPGADKIIVPILAWFEVDLTSVYTSSPTYTIIFDGDTTNLMSTSMSINLNSVVAKKSNSAVAGGISFSNYTTFNPRNKIIRLRANANPTGAGAATAVLNVVYAIIQTT